MKFGTKIIHGYNMIDESTGASSISICQASTFHQNDIDDDSESKICDCKDGKNEAYQCHIKIPAIR